MKTYGQLCAVARSLDVVGDRWSLLVVRELLISRRSRFTDLQRGLPGVPSNLLAQRLRDLETHGILTRESAAPPAAGLLYGLTERGRQLDGVVRELLKWGAGTLADAPRDATFQMHWLSMPARYLTRDSEPTAAPAIVRFGSLQEGFDLTAAAGAIAVNPCDPDVEPDAVVDGPGPALVAMLTGALPLAAAASAGVSVDGDRSTLARILPAA